MLNVFNAVAVTLLVALVAVFPAAVVGQWMPEIFNPSLQQAAFAAWLAALVSWFVARVVFKKQQEAMREAIEKSSSSGHPRAVIMTAGFLALALGVVAALHFFGDGLL